MFDSKETCANERLDDMAGDITVRWVQIENKAQRLAESRALTYRDPVGAKTHVRRFASDLGVDRLELRSMDGDALSVKRPDGCFTLFLNNSKNRIRHRFSLAHEIAHILLRPLVGLDINHRSPFAPDQDRLGEKYERLCDKMASLILMPTKTVLSVVNSPCQSASCVPAIAQSFDVSFQAAALRYLSLTPDPCAILTWRPAHDGRVTILEHSISNSPLHGWSVALELPESGNPPVASRAFYTSAMVVSHESVELSRRRGKGLVVSHASNVKVESFGHYNGSYRRVISFVYTPVPPSSTATTSYQRKDAR